MSIDGWTCPLPLRDRPNIVMGHGAGGKLATELIEHLFLPAFDNEHLRDLADAAVVELPAGRIAVSTDSFVVRPLFFPGGDIGDLAINGTVNDLSMRGARPRYVTVGLILEEGLEIATLGRVIGSLAAAARRAGVVVVTGDTKVVDRGHGDGVYINTTGIGVVPEGIDIRPGRVRPGDTVIVSGTIADHGMAIMSVREGLRFESDIVSDTAPLDGLVADLLSAGIDLHALRDPTRGGVAATLNEIAGAARLGIVIGDPQIPVRRAVASACELLGLDPLHVANEGKLIAFVAPEDAAHALEVIRSTPVGADAAIIGTVVEEHPGVVLATTALGTTRIVDTQFGEQLPRIC